MSSSWQKVGTDYAETFKPISIPATSIFAKSTVLRKQIVKSNSKNDDPTDCMPGVLSVHVQFPFYYSVIYLCCL